MEDDEGNYWFATKKRGVLKVSGNSEKLSHTEWPIGSDDQNAEKKLKNFLIRMKHICTKFVDAESVNIKGESV